MTEHSNSKDVSGWLFKWSNTTGKYEKMWFSLSKGMLACHTTQENGLMNSDEGEVISLVGAGIDFDDTPKFVIFQNGEAWHLRAVDQQEKQQWVEALSEAKDNATGNDTKLKDSVGLGSEIQIIDHKEQSMPQTSIEIIDENKDADFQFTANALSSIRAEGTIIVENAAFDNNQVLLSLTDAGAVMPSDNSSNATEDLSQINHEELNHDDEHLCGNCIDPHTGENEIQGEKDTHSQQAIRILSTMEQKLRDIQTYNSLINNSNSALQRSINAMNNSVENDIFREILNSVEEYHEISSAMTAACEEYMNLAEFNSKEWIMLYQSEHEQRVKLKHIIKSLTRFESRADGTISEDDNSFQSFDCPEPANTLRVACTDVTLQVYQAVGGPLGKKARRIRIPDRPSVSDSLWTVLKNCIGSDLSKMPLPVSFAEPLSLLQRITEDFEYAHVLDEASGCTDAATQLAYVAAFISSSYSTTIGRNGKPFNPLLGETFECDRQSDLGWRSIAEQVSHHPPVAAIHGEGKNWTLWMDQSLKTKFKGTTLTITPLGECHLNFKNGNRYSWKKPCTSIHNVIVGKIWVEQEGDVDIKCATSDVTGKLTFVSSGWTGESFTVKGMVKDSDKTVLELVGKYSAQIEYRPAGSKDRGTVIWKRTEPPADNAKYYNFTLLACQLNELENGIAPTDSRLRPDQRLMEDGNFEAANVMKKKLEDHQRANKKETWTPTWFVRKPDPDTKTEIWTYGGEYWPCKAKKDWSRCPAYIFSPQEPPHSNNT